jgi:hypothetical protein
MATASVEETASLVEERASAAEIASVKEGVTESDFCNVHQNMSNSMHAKKYGILSSSSRSIDPLSSAHSVAGSSCSTPSKINSSASADRT